jgi:hypothetical protein
MYRFTADMATARAQAAATSAIQDNQAAMNAFASVIEARLRQLSSSLAGMT